MIIGPDGRPRLGNTATQRLLGYPPEELAHIPAKDWIHPEDFELVLENLRLVEQDETAQPTFELRMISSSAVVVTAA